MKFCWFFNHDWEEYESKMYRDISFGEPGVMTKRVIYKCKKCGKYKTIDYDW